MQKEKKGDFERQIVRYVDIEKVRDREKRQTDGKIDRKAQRESGGGDLGGCLM
jgi:hypothetical protein